MPGIYPVHAVHSTVEPRHSGALRWQPLPPPLLLMPQPQPRLDCELCQQRQRQPKQQLLPGQHRAAISQWAEQLAELAAPA